MTKHELLDYIRDNQYVTIDMVANYFDRDYHAAQLALKRLRQMGLVRIAGRKNKKGFGRKPIIYELTGSGLRRVEFYDANTCPNLDCSCRKS
ncbi:MAG TPA: hypothetical protein ENG87_02805 [Candidatus Pacearchaeota archaeon]|nr:hypothetical protein [Candidatus Pacearchaeota archaeon]